MAKNWIPWSSSMFYITMVEKPPDDVTLTFIEFEIMIEYIDTSTVYTSFWPSMVSNKCAFPIENEV